MRTRWICVAAVAVGLAACGRKGVESETAGVPVGASAPVSTASPAAPVAEAAVYVPVELPASTRFRVRLVSGLDTRTTRAGNGFEATLDDAIVSGDRVVVPKGTPFHGRVLESKRSGRLKGRAYLGLTLDTFTLNGASYTIATGEDVRASGSHAKRNVALIGGGAGTGAAIGAIAGGGAGALIGAGAGAAAGTTGAIITGKKDVRLPAESTLVFTLKSTVEIGG